MTTRYLFFATLFSVLIATSAESREWTSTSGSTVEGEFVRLEGDTVIITVQRAEKKVPLDKLSAVDQSYAKQRDGELKRIAILAELGGPRASREWTNKAGEKVIAKMIGMQGNLVELSIARNSTLIPYIDLSDDDHQFVRAVMDVKIKGTWLFPNAEGALPEIRGFTLKGTYTQAQLVGIERDGKFVLQSRNGLGSFAPSAFSVTDEAHIRKEFSDRGLGDLIPADESARLWTDWKGDTFRGHIANSTTSSRLSSTIYFVLDGEKFSKRITEFNAADQSHLRQLATQSGLDVSNWPQVIPDATRPVRKWTFIGTGNPPGLPPKRPPTSVRPGDPTMPMEENDESNEPTPESREFEAAFVSLDGFNLKLRTGVGIETVSLRSISREDATALSQVLAKENGGSLPIVEAHCMTLTLDIGSLIEIKGQPQGGEGDELFVLLPDTNAGAPRSRVRIISWTALSSDSRQAVVADLAARNVPQTLQVSELSGSVSGTEEREWSISNDQSERTSKGSLKYINPTTGGITLTSTSTNIHELSLADQRYVVQAVRANGLSKFIKPDPKPVAITSRPRTPSSGYRPGYNPGPNFNPLRFEMKSCGRCGFPLHTHFRSGQTCPGCGTKLYSPEDYPRALAESRASQQNGSTPTSTPNRGSGSNGFGAHGEHGEENNMGQSSRSSTSSTPSESKKSTRKDKIESAMPSIYTLGYILGSGCFALFLAVIGVTAAAVGKRMTANK